MSEWKGLAANLSVALIEWRDAGGPVEEVTNSIVDLIYEIVESQANPDSKP